MNKWNKIKKYRVLSETKKDLKSLGEVPTKTSENIKAPKLAPKDNRFTGRTKRIAFTCRPEFAEELRKLAFEKKCYQIEILEKALEIYQKSLFSNSAEIKSNKVKSQKDHNINLAISKKYTFNKYLKRGY